MEFRRTNPGDYAVEDERQIQLKTGQVVRVRPARLGDVPQLQRLIHRLPADDLYLRFFRTLRSLSIEEAVRLCTNEQSVDAMFVAVQGATKPNRSSATPVCLVIPPVASGKWVIWWIRPCRAPASGGPCKQVLIDKAKALGMSGLTAEILADNKRMLGLARSSGLKVSMERDGDTCEVLMEW